MRAFSRNKMRHFIFILLVAAFLSSCISFGGGGSSSSRVRYPNKVNEEMQAQYQQAENLFKKKRYGAAFKAYQNYSKAYPYNKLSDKANFRVGQIHMLRRQYAAAIRQFTALSNKTPDRRIRSKSWVKVGISAYRSNNFRRAADSFSKSEVKYLSRKEVIKANSLAYYSRKRLNNNQEAYAYHLLILLDSYYGLNDQSIKQKFGPEAPLKSLLLSKLEAWAKKAVPLPNIDKKILSYKYQNKASEAYVLFKLGLAYEKAAQRSRAKRYYKAYMRKHPNGAFAALVSKKLMRMGEGVASNKNAIRVGVILPLTGKYANYGQKTLRGIECAAGVKAECKRSSAVQIIKKDDQGNPSLAAKAVEDLVLNHKVNVIIGPLSSKSSERAARKAKEYNVVLISLAQKPGVADIGPQIFSLGLTPEDQVTAILAQIKKQSVASFSILYPKNNYGRIFSQLAKSRSSNQGLKVNARQSYLPGVLDYSLELSKLPTSSRAIFVPDSIKTTLAILGQTDVYDLGKATLYGTNAWNDNRIAKYVKGRRLVFVDSFFTQSKQSKVQNFVKQFEASYGYSPSTLEAMGYDAISLLGRTLKSKKHRSVERLSSALKAMNDFNGVTGLKGFKSNGTARINPYILMTQNGKIVEK